MNSFATVLIIEDCPVGYQAFLEENSLQLKPAAVADREVTAPELFARLEENEWKVTGTTDAAIITQVQDMASLHKGKVPSSPLSAAP